MEENKATPSYLTASFNRSAGIVPLGNPPDLNLIQELPRVSAEGLKNALNPPAELTGAVLHDNFLYNIFNPLNNPDLPQTQAWYDREENQFQDYIADAKASEDSAYAFLKNATKFDAIAEVVKPFKVGDKYFRSEPDTDLSKRQVPFQVSDSKDGPWKTLLDPATLTADGSGFFDPSLMRLSEDGKYLLYYVAPFGQDEGTLHIMDTETGKNLPDSQDFEGLPWALQWDEKSHDGFKYTDDRGAWMHHVIGQSFKKDQVIAATNAGFVVPLNFGPSAYEWVNIRVGVDNNYGLAYWKKGETSKSAIGLVAPQTYSLKPLIEQANGTVLAITTKDAPNGRLISFRPDNPAPENWKTVIPESKMDILQSARILPGGKFLTHYKHDAASALRVFDFSGKPLYDAPLPVQSVISFLSKPEDDFTKDSPYVSKDGIFDLAITSFTDPDSSYAYDANKNELSLKKASIVKSTIEGAIVERLYATSKDGTKIPMTVIRDPKTKLDGTAAVKLYGYGSFGVSMGPGSNLDMEQFVKAGGIYVQTNLRGGGEFGEAWHDAGRLDNKQHTFDDLAASAELLIQKGYTVPKRIAIEGGSAGGLLTAATMVQRPDLFGAVISDRPVTDTILWDEPRVPEYGDPKRVKKDFNIAAGYSPIQNVKHGAKYPPLLVVMGDHDDRVDPGQPSRFAATVQAEGDPNNVALLHVVKGASHLAGKDPLRELAQKFAFIEKSIGPVNQDAYKAWLAAKSAANQNRTPNVAGYRFG